MRLCKVPDVICAAGFGAGRWLAIFGLTLMLGLPLVRLATAYALRGDLSPSPLATPNASHGDVAILGASSADAARIRRALHEITLHFDASAVRVRVVADAAANAGYAAEYLPEVREVILPRETVRGGAIGLRWALAHELGHYVDATYMTDALRARFMRARGVPAGRAWFSSRLPWNERPAEDFAEVFAALVQPSVDRPIETVYGRIRNRREIGAILRAARLNESTTPISPWATAVAGEGAYLADTLQDPLRLDALRALAALMAVLGAWNAVSDTIGLVTCGPRASRMR